MQVAIISPPICLCEYGFNTMHDACKIIQYKKKIVVHK